MADYGLPLKEDTKIPCGIDDRVLVSFLPHTCGRPTATAARRPHGRQARKLAISRRPRVWLFSGWNWVPAMLSLPTIAVTAPP
jgi:hypothetical protein